MKMNTFQSPLYIAASDAFLFSENKVGIAEALLNNANQAENEIAAYQLARVAQRTLAASKKGHKAAETYLSCNYETYPQLSNDIWRLKSRITGVETGIAKLFKPLSERYTEKEVLLIIENLFSKDKDVAEAYVYLWSVRNDPPSDASKIYGPLKTIRNHYINYTNPRKYFIQDSEILNNIPSLGGMIYFEWTPGMLLTYLCFSGARTLEYTVGESTSTLLDD